MWAGVHGIVPRYADRHQFTGRFLAYNCEVDCLRVCAGLCGNMFPENAECLNSNGSTASVVLHGWGITGKPVIGAGNGVS